MILNPFCGSAGYARHVGFMAGLLIGQAVGRKSLLGGLTQAGLIGCLLGTLLGTQVDCGKKAASTTTDTLSGHFPTPEFMLPTYFEQETQLLDPRRG